MNYVIERSISASLLVSVEDGKTQEAFVSNTQHPPTLSHIYTLSFPIKRLEAYCTQKPMLCQFGLLYILYMCFCVTLTITNFGSLVVSQMTD